MTENDEAWATRKEAPAVRPAEPAGHHTRREDPLGTRREDADELLTQLPRELAARYTIEGELESFGGEANLLLVRDQRGVRRVIKLYRRRGDQAARDVWERLEHLSTGHVIRIVETGQTGSGHDFEVMEYVAGGSLAELVRRVGGPAAPALVRNVVRQVASALKQLHDQHIVHQDLKPENVLVRSETPLDLAVTDFGISRVLDQTRVAAGASGTLAYLAPELRLASGGRTSPARDWWALGMIARELLIGQRPFQDMMESAIDASLLLRNIDLPGIDDPQLRRLCRGLLTKDPDARWDWTEVEQWLDGGSPPVSDEPTVQESQITATRTGQAVGTNRQPLIFRQKSYVDRKELVRALAEPDAWATACERYFTTMGTTDHPSEGWRRLRVWLTRFDAADQDEELQRLVDLELTDETAGPDAKLIRLIRWLDPEAPAMCRGRLVDPANLAAAADDARAAQALDDERLLFIDALWSQRLLQELALQPTGSSLDEVDHAWRAAEHRYRAAQARIRGAMTPDFREPPPPVGTRDVLAPLLSLVLEPEEETASLQQRMAEVAARTNKVSWYTSARQAAGDEPAAVLATLFLAPGALADADYLDRQAAANQEEKQRRSEQWQTMESRRRSSSALAAARLSAIVPFAIYAVVICLVAVVGLKIDPNAKNSVVPMLVIGLLLAVGQLVAEMVLATEIGSQYRQGYGLFSRSGPALQAAGRGVRGPARGCGVIVLALIVVPFLLAVPILLYVVLAILHVRSIVNRRRDWRSRYRAEEIRVRGSE
ncbi:serine/threonine-protein kinase [Kribbella sp. NPDC058693]|uniref:serine/threonine-protein kinase n=1 Tax=Kribbella sp. NPDC058693 TaxID=3346602 RepID=UPI00365E34C9